MQSAGSSWREINWNGNCRLEVFKNMSISREFVLYLEIPENAVIFGSGNFRNFKSKCTEKSSKLKKSRPRSKMKPILIFNFGRSINEFSKVLVFLSQNMAGLSNHLRKSIFALSLAKKQNN